MTAHIASINPNFDAKNSQPRSLVFIDESVSDSQLLAAGVSEGMKVITLKQDSDGIEQITTEIQNYADIYGSIDAIHIFSHGSSGNVYLGNSRIVERHNGRIWVESAPGEGTAIFFTLEREA